MSFFGLLVAPLKSKEIYMLLLDVFAVKPLSTTTTILHLERQIFFFTLYGYYIIQSILTEIIQVAKLVKI